jgi:hypothetical protein
LPVFWGQYSHFQPGDDFLPTGGGFPDGPSASSSSGIPRSTPDLFEPPDRPSAASSSGIPGSTSGIVSEPVQPDPGSLEDQEDDRRDVGESNPNVPDRQDEENVSEGWNHF